MKTCVSLFPTKEHAAVHRTASPARRLTQQIALSHCTLRQCAVLSCQSRTAAMRHHRHWPRCQSNVDEGLLCSMVPRAVRCAYECVLVIHRGVLEQPTLCTDHHGDASNTTRAWSHLILDSPDRRRKYAARGSLGAPLCKWCLASLRLMDTKLNSSLSTARAASTSAVHNGRTGLRCLPRSAADQ